jgi:hypothetical protein
MNTCTGCSSEVEHELHECGPRPMNIGNPDCREYFCDYCFVALKIEQVQTQNLACMFNVLERKLTEKLK